MFAGQIFPCRDDPLEKTPPGSADVPSVTGAAVSGTEEGGKHGRQARDVCPGEPLLSIPEQIDFQDFSISSNANSAVTVGS